MARRKTTKPDAEADKPAEDPPKKAPARKPRAKKPAKPDNEPPPELLARLDQATRRFELLERRVSSWERRLNDLEKSHGEITPPEAPAGERMDDLEARLARLERKRFQQLAREAAAGKTVELDSRPTSAAPTAPSDAHALVFAQWSPPEMAKGKQVELVVQIDGFEPKDTIIFEINELGNEDSKPVTLEAQVGDAKDELRVRWKPPASRKKTPGGQREYTYLASCRGAQARSPVLVVKG